MVETGCYVAFYVLSAASAPQVEAHSLGVEKFKILFSHLCVQLHAVCFTFRDCSSFIKTTFTINSVALVVFEYSYILEWYSGECKRLLEYQLSGERDWPPA